MGNQFSKPDEPAPTTSSGNNLVMGTWTSWTSMEQVLSIHHLREKIFEEVLLVPKKRLEPYEQDEQRYDSPMKMKLELSMSRARDLRLVSRRWNFLITSLFERAGQPLLNIGVGMHSPAKTLLEALEARVSFPQLQNPPPSVQLSVSFRNQLQRLVWGDGTRYIQRIIELIGESLITLKIEEPDGDIGQTVFDFSTLPVLKKILIIEATPIRANHDIRNRNFEDFVQALLDSTQTLEEFRLEKSIKPHCSHWTFPRTLRKLYTIYTTQLFASPMAPLPANLNVLKLLNTSTDLVGDENLIEILESCCLSLEEFSIDHGRDRLEHMQEAIQLNLSRFPKLPNLKMLGLLAREWVWLDGGIHVGEKFPRLNHLSFGIWEGGINQFLDGFCSSERPSPSLSSLHLDMSPVNRNLIPTRSMRSIRSYYPQMVHLKLTRIVGENASILENVFSVFTQLESLSVRFADTLGVTGLNLNAFLTGTTPKTIEGLMGNPELVDAFALEANLDDFEASIRNMRMLQSFFLHGGNFSEENGNERLITRLSFRLGFMLAPQLRRLEMYGSFAVSREDADLWKAHGGTIVTPPFFDDDDDDN